MNENGYLYENEMNNSFANTENNSQSTASGYQNDVDQLSQEQVVPQKKEGFLKKIWKISLYRNLLIIGIVLLIIIVVFSVVKKKNEAAENSIGSSSASGTSSSKSQKNTFTQIKQNETPVNGIRPSVKKALDEYEDFFDEYCRFMKSYNTSSNTGAMLLDYMSFLQEYSEAMTALEEMEDDLTGKEVDYYAQVMGRITTKLVQVAYGN